MVDQTTDTQDKTEAAPLQAPATTQEAIGEIVSEVVTNTKAFYKSKIVWLALITIFLGASDQLSLLATHIPAAYQGIATSILGLLILLARAYSGTSLTIKK
jgi:uncharacterized membrane protein